RSRGLQDAERRRQEVAQDAGQRSARVQVERRRNQGFRGDDGQQRQSRIQRQGRRQRTQKRTPGKERAQGKEGPQGKRRSQGFGRRNQAQRACTPADLLSREGGARLDEEARLQVGDAGSAFPEDHAEHGRQRGRG